MPNQLTKPFKYKKIKLNNENSQFNQKRKTKDTLGTLSRIWQYLSYQKGKVILVLIAVILSASLGLLGPILIGTAIDTYIVKKEISGLISLLFSLAIVYVLHASSVLAQNFWMIGIAQHTVYRMRKDLFHHLHKLSLPYFDKRQHGETMSRVTNDIDNVSSTLNSSFIQITSSVLTLIGTVSVMLWLSPLLTLITLTIVPVMVLCLKWITNRTSYIFKLQQRKLGDLNGFIEETISGRKIVKSFSQETRVISAFREKSEQFRGTAFWAQTYSGFIPKVMNSLNHLSFAIIAGIGGLFALKGYISIGTIVIFAEYARQFTRPINDLANQFNTLLSAVAGAERVFEVLDEDDEEVDESDAIELENLNGNVQFLEASFSYEGEEHTVERISFQAKQGETIALVGPTGAGKTTILNLLARFYDVNEGKILIDGHDIRGIKRASLRKHMGFVLQDTYLFEGTIKENISYGTFHASNEQIEQAAKLANAHSFIMKLPKGYESVLNQDGGGISQGQKQLISIARAILSDPSILVLDEATSSIDTVTEVKIQEALTHLMAGRTSFVIAHRLNTIRNADQILVLKDGEIIEQGSHQYLLNQNGYYSELYESQFKK